LPEIFGTHARTKAEFRPPTPFPVTGLLTSPSDTIAQRQAAHAAAAQRLAGRLFAEKPKAFRDRLAALWKNRIEAPH